MKYKIFIDSAQTDGTCSCYVQNVYVGNFWTSGGEMNFSDDIFGNHSSSDDDIADIFKTAEKTYDNYMDFFDTLDDWNNDSEMVAKYAEDHNSTIKAIQEIRPTNDNAGTIDILADYWSFARETEHIYAHTFFSEDEFKEACYNLLLSKGNYFKNFVINLQDTISKANIF